MCGLVRLIYTAISASHSNESGQSGDSTYPADPTVQISNVKVFDQSRLGSSLLDRAPTERASKPLRLTLATVTNSLGQWTRRQLPVVQLRVADVRHRYRC